LQQWKEGEGYANEPFASCLSDRRRSLGSGHRGGPGDSAHQYYQRINSAASRVVEQRGFIDPRSPEYAGASTAAAVAADAIGTAVQRWPQRELDQFRWVVFRRKFFERRIECRDPQRV